MTISDVLNTWFSSIKKIAFRYKDGFFELPLISNSPETIIKSLARMPFVYNDQKKEIFGTKNPFVNAEVPYQKIDDGLWVFYSKAQYKENVSYIRKKESTIPDEYCKLYLEINVNKTNHKNVLLNGIPYSNSCWVLHKPFNNSTYCKFKGCETVTIVLQFTRRWLDDFLNKNEFYQKSQIADFFNSNAEFIMIPDDPIKAEELRRTIRNLFDKKAIRKDHPEHWRNWALEFLEIFISRFNEENILAKMYDFAHADRIKLAKVEKILVDGLYDNFVGIDYLANKVGLSSTKLKSNFKLVYGSSIFQYFRKVQMEHAKEILAKNKDLKIQEMANTFGYKNMTKFSNAFKNVHGTFPSEFRNVYSS